MTDPTNIQALALATLAAKLARAAKDDTSIQAQKLYLWNATLGRLQEVWLEGSGDEVHFVFGS